MSGTSIPSKSTTKKPKSEQEAPRDPLVGDPWLPYWCVASILIVLAAIIYLPYLSGEFIWDDKVEIEASAHLRNLSDPWTLMTHGVALPPRPLPYLTFALNFALLGEDIRWFRVVNWLIHLANGFLVFGLIQKLARIQRESELLAANSRLFAATCAAIWLVHPIAVHVVSYVYQRQESLTALFMLLSLVLFVAYRVDSPRRRWLIGSLAACALAMACKETAVVTPILIVLIDYFFFSQETPWRTLRERWATFGLYFATWTVLAAAMYFKQTGYLELAKPPSTPFHYLLTQSKVILHYVYFAFLPDHVAITYALPIETSPLAVLPQLTILTVAFAASIWGAYRRHLWAFLGCWFFINLAPTSSVMPIAQPIQDYRIYLASLSLICLSSYALLLAASFFSKPMGRTIFLALFAAAIGTLCWQTASFAQVFQSDLKVWQAALPYCPNDSNTLVNLMQALNKAGRYPETIFCLQNGIHENGLDERLVSEYLVAMKKVGREKEALPIADELAKRDELIAETCFAIGNIYSELEPAKAIEFYERTLQLEPDSYQALINIGVIYARTDPQRSLDYLMRATKMNSTNPTAYLNLGYSFARLNRFDEAIEYFDAAILLDPENATAIHNRQIIIQMRDKQAAGEAKSN